MSDIQISSEEAAQALPGLEALRQSFQNIQLQIGGLASAFGNLGPQVVAFSALSSGIYAMKLAVDALCSSYTLLLDKLANSGPLEMLAGLIADLSLKIGENNIVVYQTIESGGGLYDSIMATISATGTSIQALYTLIGAQRLSSIAGWAAAAAGWVLKGVTSALTVVQNGLKVAQIALNGTMLANPVFWIIAGIAGLIAVVVVLWNKFEGFRKVVLGVWEVLKSFGQLLLETIMGAIRGIISGVSKLGEAIMHLFKGDFTKAWEVGKEGAVELGKGVVSMVPVVAAVNAATQVEYGEAWNKGAAKAADDTEPSDKGGFGLPGLEGLSGAGAPSIHGFEGLSGAGASSIPGLEGLSGAGASSIPGFEGLSGAQGKNAAFDIPATLPTPASTSAGAHAQEIHFHIDNVLAIEHLEISNSEELKNAQETIKDEVIGTLARVVREASPKASSQSLSFA